MPPDRRGLLHEIDVKALADFGEALRTTFKQNLVAKAKVKASNVRGHDKAFGPQNLFDGKRATYWSTDDAVKTAEVTFDFERPATFNVIRLREAIQLGQRIDSIEFDQWKDGAWSKFAEATSIGSCRIIRTTENIATSRVRLRITQAAACPALSEFGLYMEAAV